MSEPFKINLPDGAELRLSIITPSDWITYTDRFRTDRKIRHTQSLRYAGIDGDKLVEKLNVFDARRLRQYDVQQWVTELDGAAEMLALSISRGWEVWRDGQCAEKHDPAKRGVDDIPPDLSHLDYVETAAGVANLKLTYKDVPDPNEESAGQTETGGATPTESDTGSAPALTIP